MLVANIPIKRPMKGFDVVLIRLSAKPLPKPLKAVSMTPILTRKQYSRLATRSTFERLFIVLFMRFVIRFDANSNERPTNVKGMTVRIVLILYRPNIRGFSVNFKGASQD